MEPGEYLTNVLSFNNYSNIYYEYLEPQAFSSGPNRKHLQKLEAGWRRDGKLVYCDPMRDGVWLFQRSTSGPKDVSGPAEHTSTDVDLPGLGLLQRESGTYEPASLVKNKQAGSNTITTPSSSSSPSSSMETTLRNAQTWHARSAQSNASISIQEPPTPSPGTKSSMGGSIPPLKSIHEYFISAVLGSIVYFLGRGHGFIPLNSRTLISSAYLSPQVDVTVELATLDISLTSLGTLVVKAYSDVAAGLQRLTDDIGSIQPGSALWLAPGGNAAKFYGAIDDKNLPNSTAYSQIPGDSEDIRSDSSIITTIKSWQVKCLEWLSGKGMDQTALEADGWVLVQCLGGNTPYLGSDFQKLPLSDELAILPWPARLCFQTSVQKDQDMPGLHTSNLGHRDPLSFAEDWFGGKEERGNTIAKRSKERQVAVALAREQADVDARANQSQAYSSAVLRRGSNAGAMYPTPPDAPQHPIGATPNFDGNVSTPGNPTPFISAGDPVNTISTNSGPDVDMWGSSGKKEQNFSGLNFNQSEQDNDNLFGDLGGDIFGNDITDADFSFFDEPDDIQLGEEPTSSFAKPRPTIPEPSPLEDPPADDVNTHSPNVNDNVKIEDVQDPPSGSPQRTEGDARPGILEVPEQTTSVEAGDTVIVAAKTTASTSTAIFNMESVFNQLSQEFSDKKISENRRPSLFNEIRFQDSLLSVNNKYGTSGRFKFQGKEPRSRPVILPTLPQTEYLSKRRRTQDNGSQLGTLARILGRDGASPVKVDAQLAYLADSECGSQVSEQDDTSPTNESSPFPKFGTKRKWEIDASEDTIPSFDPLAMDYDHPVSTPHSLSGSQLPLFDPDPADWSLTSYFTSPEPDMFSNTLSDLERIATAQILADQATSSTLGFPGVGRRDALSTSSKTATTRKLIQSLAKVSSLCLDDAKPCSMRSFLEIQGIPILNQGLRLPPRPVANSRGPSSTDPQRPNNPYPITPPQLEIRRSDSKLSTLPAAVTFWENLGLGPSKGTKDVQAICLYPDSDGVGDSAALFIDQMRSVYESSRLGSHERIVTKDGSNGLIPFNADPVQYSQHNQLASLRDMPVKLSRVLASLSEEKKNFVVYVLYPIDDKRMLVDICSSFRHLFNLYRKALSERRLIPSNELVLQVIPLDFVARAMSLVVPAPSQYFALAMEVYDRCTDFASMASTPAIMLEQPLPKTIDFKLNATPSASLLHENTCLHIAYAQSIDDRWITAAWTDNRGTQQMTSSYCLGRKNEPISMSFSDVANEIWETTLDFISSKKIHWRIIIARIGVMDPSEHEFWTSLASTEANAQLSLTLVTVQTDPSLRLLPPPSSIIPSGTSAPSVVTPVSTPQASQVSILSPDNAPTPARDNTSAATPNEAPIEPDTDARLVDYTDQTWGAVLSHRLNNSNSLVEVNPALISGYLIKRGGTNPDDPPVVMEVNIIHGEVVGNPRTFHECLLKEILGYYSGLGTLARVRSIVESARDVRPWHIAAAEKAVKALYMLM